ncbi:MAG: ABC transporter ATP-binding protein [Cyclobacteriaceae bacterium]|nr:ABC transporter ATP-binding protein [Cyclobacteriaceae bacterium]
MIEIEKLSKSYGRERVLRDLDLQCERGSTISILGKSGGGKTSLLKIIAGIARQDTGIIRIDGVDHSQTKSSLRKAYYIFQEPLLFPHLNVFQNIAFGLKLKKTDKTVLHAQTTTMMEMLELPEHATKYPHELSGGQKQRVAFGRALVMQPQVLLLDEPFGALDTETRAMMQQLYLRLSGELNFTALFVTHDLKEALTVGDKYAVLKNGSCDIHNGIESLMADKESGLEAEVSFWSNYMNNA